MTQFKSLYVGKKLKLLRVSLDLSQDEMAQELGISRSYLAAIEISKRKITQKMLKRIKARWGVDEGYFVSGEAEENAPILRVKNEGVLEGVNAPSTKGAQKIKSNQDGRRVIFERKLNQYLKENQDILILYSAAVEVRDFEKVLSLINEKYLDKSLWFPDFENPSFEETMHYVLKNVEQLKPFKEAFWNLAMAIRTFYKEMYKAGDKDFDWAEKE